jgi:hypothetical protein
MTVDISPSTFTAPVSTPATSDWLRELVDTRNTYEEMLGWPILLEVATRKLVMTTGTILDAIVMPAALGEKVLAELRSAILASYVIAGPGNASWTFITEPAVASTPTPTLPADLVPARVECVPHGSQITLPTTLDPLSAWSWVTPCRRRSLTPWPAVIATARRIVARAATGR